MANTTARLKANAGDLTPDQINALKLFKKGAALQKRGAVREAAKLHLKGLKFDKDSIFGMKLLADALAKMGRRNLAIQTYEHALARAPEDYDIHFGLGALAQTMNMLDVAAQFFEIYVQNRPNDPAGYNNLATVWRHQEKLDQAVALLQRIVPQFPESSDLWNTLGTVVYDRDGLDAATPFYEEALRLDPKSSKALSNLAKCLEDKGDFERGIEISRRAIRADKHLTEPRMVLAHCLLTMGDLEEGWKSYVARLDPGRPGTTFYSHGLPEWRGEDISDKTILVCPEQGIGDEILFASVFGELVQRAGKCMIGSDQRLVPLFERSFPGAACSYYIDRNVDAHRLRTMPVFEAKDAEHADVAITAGELMKFFRPTPESFPDRAGFLTPDPERVAFWRTRLDALGTGPKVGICWRSGRQSIDRNRHYTKLDQWGPILTVPGVHFVNLQYDDCRDELDKARADNDIAIHVWNDINLRNDIDDAAALTAALDLVISPATAVAMTAIGVGTELWSVLRIIPYWAFGRRDTTPLHSASRLFVWPEGGGPSDVIANVAAALRERVHN